MTRNAAEYRLSVDRYRDRLNLLAEGALDHQRRPKIITTGRKQPFYKQDDLPIRLTVYGRRRQASVARALALMSLLRDTEMLTQPAANVRSADQGNPRYRRPVVATFTGAKWQSHGGTKEFPACHTCPALVHLNDLPPTCLTDNLGLRRMIINCFADCMMMPKSVNDADSGVDSSAGKATFASAVEVVINHASVGWEKGLRLYLAGMREILEPVWEILFMPETRHFQADSPGDQQKLESVIAFYEGLFLTPVPVHEVENLLQAARREMAL